MSTISGIIILQEAITDFLDLLNHDDSFEIDEILEEKLNSTPSGVAPPFYVVWCLRIKAMFLYEKTQESVIKSMGSEIRPLKTNNELDASGTSQVRLQNQN